MTTGQLRRYDPATQAELLPHAGTIDRLGVVEDASGGSLPTSMSLALAETGLDEGDVRKASILIARELDLDHNWVLPTYYVRRIGEAFTTDPISGNVISLETARRLAKPYNAEVLSSILGSALERPSTTGASPGELGGQAAVAAANKTFLDRTAKLIQSFAPLDGDAVSWSDAIGAALYLARDGTNLQAFDANLRITADVQGMSELEKIGVAHAAAQAKVSLHNRFDVVQFAATSPEERALWQRAEQAGGLSPALRARFTETNQALRPGENAQVLRGSVFALADDIKANTGNYVAEGKAVVAKQRLEEVAFGHSMLGKVMGGVGYSMDRLVGSVGAGFRLAIGSPQQGVPLGHLITGDVAGVKEAWHDAQDAFWGRSNYFQDLAVDSFHLPRWTGSLIELGALWYLSPDVLAGRLISASRYA
ncbi:MAG TPA: hypothetical protein VGR13_04145, partial [Actinomycetota bacterium]|nr:hypothetical protein [Actinomycetota bacterium]